MATPKNLIAEFPDYCSGCIHGEYEIDTEFPDYCSGCIHGDYEIDTEQAYFGRIDYIVRCTHQEVCIDWVNKINTESRHKEVTDG